MKFAYADPPYLGCATKYDHPETRKWNTLAAHIDLMRLLELEYPDGWAMSLHSPSLQAILPHAPPLSAFSGTGMGQAVLLLQARSWPSVYLGAGHFLWRA